MVAHWGDINRYLGFSFLIVGIVTAILDVSIRGFAPILWFLLAIFCFIIVICTEIVQLRMVLESKREK